MDLNKLKQSIEGQLFTDEETRQDVSSDFGRIIVRHPAVVVLPASAGDVATTVKMASAEGWAVSARGSGHSQNGQSLNENGILIDMTGLHRTGRIERESLWVDAGVLWQDVVNETLDQRLVPPVLTDDLNATVGGTLSAGGLSAASHRFGTSADNVEELEAVTGEGHLVRCSAQENRELFDCSRCGLGQFSVITRARLKLRRCAARVRTFFLLYDDLSALMQDQERIIADGRIDYIDCFSSPCAQGVRRLGETRMPFAEWFYPLHLSVEYGESAPDPETVLSGLHFYRNVHGEDSGLSEFVARMEAVFQLWKESSAWNHAHPWMEAFLPWEHAAAYVQGVLKGLPPHLLAGGQVLLRPVRQDVSHAPLLKRPVGSLMMWFGIRPAAPKAAVARLLPLVEKASDLAMQIGGKRYLSGWLHFDHDRWKAHFGETWEELLRWKRFYDPKGILNPGLIRYEPEPERSASGPTGG